MKFNFDNFALHIRISLANNGSAMKDRSLRKTSKLIGISYSTLNRAIKGDKLDIDIIIKICQHCDLELYDFIY